MPYKNPEDKKRADAAYWRKIKGAGNATAIAPKYNRPIGVVQRLKDIKVPKHGLKIAVLPDCQVMPGVDTRHLSWAGRYIAAKRPDVIVCIGDFGDIPSLSKFDVNTIRAEGKRYRNDIGAVHKGMELFLNPIRKEKGYKPFLEFTEGNHEAHIERYVTTNPVLEGFMSRDDLKLEEYGWRVHDFLQPISIADVAFCHYFPSGQMGRPISTATQILNKLHMSAFAGHQQGREIAYSRRADGSNMTAIISGSFYTHKYEYLSPFTNGHWRGMFMLHEVKGGQFDEMAVSIEFLKRKFS